MDFILALVLVVVAFLLLWIGSRAQRSSGLPAGRVLYSDPKIVGSPERPLFDGDLMLTGKPDYLVEDKGALIPVEVKSGWAPPEPYEGHVFQLLAYCVLVERNEGRRPPYGILRYRDRSFAIDFTREAEQRLVQMVEEMHDAGASRNLARSHEEAQRCAKCGYRGVCDGRLP